MSEPITGKLFTSLSIQLGDSSGSSRWSQPAPVSRWLERFKDPRLSVQQIALADRNGTATMYGAGLLGGSLLAEKRQIASKVEKVINEEVRLQRATEWFEENVPPSAAVYLKMNCEGGEVAILNDLLDSGMIDRVTSMYVDFDIRKVEGRAGEQEEIERRLKERGVHYVSRAVFDADPKGKFRQWLAAQCPRVRPSPIQALHYKLRLYAPAYMQATALVGAVLPKRLYWWLGRRFGRLARSQAR